MRVDWWDFSTPPGLCKPLIGARRWDSRPSQVLDLKKTC
jgi:hypothetical protein